MLNEAARTPPPPPPPKLNPFERGKKTAEGSLKIGQSVVRPSVRPFVATLMEYFAASLSPAEPEQKEGHPSRLPPRHALPFRSPVRHCSQCLHHQMNLWKVASILFVSCFAASFFVGNQVNVFPVPPSSVLHEAVEITIPSDI